MSRGTDDASRGPYDGPAGAPMRSGKSSLWGGDPEPEDTRLRRHLSLIDNRLSRYWKLGRNLIVGWRPGEQSIDLLLLPQYLLPTLNDDDDLLSETHILSDGRFDAVSRALDLDPVHIDLPFTPGGDGPTLAQIDATVRRYSVTKSAFRGAILFDIVGFSLYSPLEQVTLLNSLAYSINTAHSRALTNNLPIDLGRSTTGDGFYVWNRDTGLAADLNLFYLLMIILADNALARAKGHPNTTPVLRTSFHVGSHYEYYQAEGLNPGLNGYIVGDLTIELARMIGKALPGQILIGDFSRTDDTPVAAGGNGNRESPRDPSMKLEIDTPAFVERTQAKLDQLTKLVLAGEKISAIRAYLTGEQMGRGTFDIKRYTILDKHGFRRDVFNAKVNIHRGASVPLFLGLGSRDLHRFDAVERAYGGDTDAQEADFVVQLNSKK